MSTLCPPPTVLEQFLLGGLDETASQVLETHVADCPHCGKQAATIKAEDAVVVALRGAAFETEGFATAHTLATVSDDLVRLLLPHYKRITSLLDETIAPTTPGSLAETIAPHEGAKPASETPTNKLGPYEIRGVLGSGGMGTVLHAFDPLLKRSVGIKVIQAKYLAEPEMQERLVREAQAAAAVEHENIVSIYAVETHNAAPCIIMPLLRGMSLKQRLDEHAGPLPVAEILRIAHETTQGLAAAHTNGLIHRDIKPANIWLEMPRDRVKILDFGLAIASGDESARLEGISGTPGYLAPEQARGLALDQRTDIFSLGCVFYRMATGQPPFQGEKSMRVLWTVLSDRPPAAIQLNPQLPKEFSDLISQMLARDPAERPESCAVVLETLAAIDRRLKEQAGIQSRRRWIAAVFFVAILSGASVGLWSLLTMVPVAEPVKTTIIGDEPPTAIVLRHDGKEQVVTLGREKTLDLLPGDYSVRLVAEQPGRTLFPDRFSVVDGNPKTVRIAVVGEVKKHSHTQPVTGVAVANTADGLRVYSVGQDRVLTAWNPSSEKPPFVQLPHTAHCLAVSPSGNDVATAGGNPQPPAELAIRIWETSELTERGKPLAGHKRIVRALAYSPDGSQLASADADGVLLWNLNTGESQALPQDEPHAVYALAFSKDGENLLSGGDEGRVVLWNVRTQKPLEPPPASAAAVRTVAFLGDRFITAGDDGIIRIWNAGKLQHEWLGHTTPVQALAVAADGRQVISGDADGNIRVWSVATGETIHTLRAGNRAVASLSYIDKTRQVVSGGADQFVRLWQLPFSD